MYADVMRQIVVLGAFFVLTGIVQAQKPVKITLSNPSAFPMEDAVIRIRLSDIQGKHARVDTRYYPVKAGKMLPAQWNDTNGDGQADEIVFLAALPGQVQETVFLRPYKGGQAPVFEKRTQAELSHKTGGHWEGRKYVGGTFGNVGSLRVPAEHTDHSYFIRYEGPGWESDKVGYRFYLDWRNATDIFGKTIPGMVLQDVGQDGFDSYHTLADWGMDVLKVGESLGVGSLGYWNNGKAQRVDMTDSLYCEVAWNGPVESAIRTVYSGWKAGNAQTDVHSELSIAAGSHLTRHQIQLTAPLDNLCTGIVKLPDSELFESNASGAWAYLATFGKQSLNNDLLGMAIFYRTKALIEKTGDKHSHVLVLRPENNRLEYYFMGAWEKEPDGPKSLSDFQRDLDRILETLNTPVSTAF